MITDVDCVVVVACEVEPFLVHFRRRDASAENAFTGPRRVDVFERVRNGVSVGVLLFLVDRRIGLDVQLYDVRKVCFKFSS